MSYPHYLREVHGDAGPDGRPAEVPMDVQVKFGKAVMVIAAGDGELSSVEREYFLAMARGFGASDQIIEQYRKFDPHSEKLENLLSPEYRSMARHFIYDAIKVSRADGYHQKEHEQVLRAAKLLGIDTWTVQAIESLVQAEEGLRSTRLALLSPPPS